MYTELHARIWLSMPWGKLANVAARLKYCSTVRKNEGSEEIMDVNRATPFPVLPFRVVFFVFAAAVVCERFEDVDAVFLFDAIEENACLNS